MVQEKSVFGFGRNLYVQTILSHHQGWKPEILDEGTLKERCGHGYIVRANSQGYQSAVYQSCQVSRL